MAPHADQRTLIFEAYTSSLNVLDFTNVVIPVTFADKRVDRTSPDFKPLTEQDRTNMALCTLALSSRWQVVLQLGSQRTNLKGPQLGLLTAADDPDVHDGAPAAIQIVGRRLDEERLLSMAQLVVEALDKYNRKHNRD